MHLFTAGEPSCRSFSPARLKKKKKKERNLKQVRLFTKG